MSGLFGKPKVAAPTPVVDPNDVSNRKGEARLKKLQSGGSASTLLTDAIEKRQAARPRQTLVGLPG